MEHFPWYENACYFLVDLEPDALGIYSNYLALNATKPVGVTDEIRQRVEGISQPRSTSCVAFCFLPFFTQLTFVQRMVE